MRGASISVVPVGRDGNGLRNGGDGVGGGRHDVGVPPHGGGGRHQRHDVKGVGAAAGDGTARQVMPRQGRQGGGGAGAAASLGRLLV